MLHATVNIDSKLTPLQLLMAFANIELPIESCMHRSVQTGRGLVHKQVAISGNVQSSQCLAQSELPCPQNQHRYFWALH